MRAASFWRTQPSRPRASQHSRASASESSRCPLSISPGVNDFEIAEATYRAAVARYDNQLSILQFGADVHAARVTCSTQLLGRRHASASKPQDAKSHNKERTATEYQLCYCRVSSLICRRRGQCAVEEDNQRTLTGKGSATVILIRRN